MQELRNLARIGGKVGAVDERARGRMRIISSSSGFVRAAKSGSLHMGSDENTGSGFAGVRIVASPPSLQYILAVIFQTTSFSQQVLQ